MADPLGQEPGLEDADGVIVPISSGRRLQIVATTRYRAIRAMWFGACVVDVLVGLRFLQGLVGVLGHRHFVAQHAQVGFQDHPPGSLVIDDQDCGAAQIFGSGRNWLGRSERQRDSGAVYRWQWRVLPVAS